MRKNLIYNNSSIQFSYVVVQCYKSENIITEKKAKKQSKKMPKCGKIQELSTAVDTNSSGNQQQQGR